MRRPLVLLLLLFSLFWQAVALAGHVTSPVAEDAEQAHALLHWQEAAHHHDEDGGVHLDDSQDAVQHIALDGALHGAALLPACLPLPAGAAGVAPVVLQDRLAPGPFLLGLRRPPRHGA